MLKRFIPVLTLVTLCWVVFAINTLLCQGHLNQFGIVPRHFDRVSGILWAPFLHGSMRHLIANSLPLLVLGGILCYRSRFEFMVVAAAGTLLTGGLTWVFARTASHIGASGLVFCLFSYVASQAYFRRTLGALVVSAGCILAYGGMLKGVLPTSAAVSWEAHAAGLLVGVLLAWAASKLSPVRKESSLAIPASTDEIINSPR